MVKIDFEAKPLPKVLFSGFGIFFENHFNCLSRPNNVLYGMLMKFPDDKFFGRTLTNPAPQVPPFLFRIYQGLDYYLT